MRILITTILILISFLTAFSQSSIPSVDIRTINGTVFNTSGISNEDKPIVISFWATWCKPCVKELIISIDDTKSMARVKPFVNVKEWDFEVYLDPNGDFKRAMNVGNVPHTFLLNGNMEIVSQHTTYAEGDEDDLFEEIQELVD